MIFLAFKTQYLAMSYRNAIPEQFFVSGDMCRWARHYLTHGVQQNPWMSFLYKICFGVNSIRQRALKKRNFVVMGFVIKVLWQDHTFVTKCTLNALCLIFLYNMYNSWMRSFIKFHSSAIAVKKNVPLFSFIPMESTLKLRWLCGALFVDWDPGSLITTHLILWKVWFNVTNAIPNCQQDPIHCGMGNLIFFGP